jgi:hypothetical protein
MAFSRPLGTADAVLEDSHCVLKGFDAYANGAAVVFYLRHMLPGTQNPDNTQVPIPVSLASGESVGDWFDEGKTFPNGVYLDVISGGANLVGSVWIS